MDQYIALTEFARQKFVEIRLPGQKMIVKPNSAILSLGCVMEL